MDEWITPFQVYTENYHKYQICSTNLEHTLMLHNTYHPAENNLSFRKSEDSQSYYIKKLESEFE